MTGFFIVAAMYAVLWALMLAPGAYVLTRREGRQPIPDDDPAPAAWVTRARRTLVARSAGKTVRPAGVPLATPPRRGEPRASESAARVAGDLSVAEGSLIAIGLIVDGSLRCAPGSRLLAPVWVRGNVILEDGARTASLIVDGSLTLQTGARVEGSAWARDGMTLEAEARIEGVAVSRRPIVLGARAIVRSAYAPVIRGGPTPPDVEVVPRTEPEAFDPDAWDPKLDPILEELWAESRVDEIVDEIESRAGVQVRPYQVLRRGRRLGLHESGVPRRPRFLGRRPAWVLSLETVRIGADVRIPPRERVGYSLVVEGALEIHEGAELEAPVRSGRGLLLHSGAVVHGPAVSDGLVVCEENSTVLGPVDSSMHVLLFANSRVGTKVSRGVHAKGAIGIEPGAEILGGAVAGLGVRGEPLRPDAFRSAPPEELEEPKRGTKRTRRRRRRRPPRKGGRPKAGAAPAEARPDGRPAEDAGARRGKATKPGSSRRKPAPKAGARKGKSSEADARPEPRPKRPPSEAKRPKTKRPAADRTRTPPSDVPEQKPTAKPRRRRRARKRRGRRRPPPPTG